MLINFFIVALLLVNAGSLGLSLFFCHFLSCKPLLLIHFKTHKQKLVTLDHPEELFAALNEIEEAYAGYEVI